ncbi:GNAT family N-acetyltransferase [Candidatus Latescibacterota bacterium]
MPYRFEPMTAAAAEKIKSWRYEPPFDFYDLDANPDDLAEFMDERNWPDTFYAVHDEWGSLAGFFVFERKGAAADIGLGLRPDLTGDGAGRRFVEAGLAFGTESLGITSYRLEVARFNTRAISVYRRVGFTETTRFVQETNGGRYDFIRMERPAPSD